MLHEDILSVQAALGDVIWRVHDKDVEEILKKCRENLLSCAEQAEQFSGSMTPIKNLDISEVCGGAY